MSDDDKKKTQNKFRGPGEWISQAKRLESGDSAPKGKKPDQD